MKRGLARSLACLGSLLHGLHYQPWNTTTAKLCVCVYVCLDSKSSAEANASAAQTRIF